MHPGSKLFHPDNAERLDDPARREWLPTEGIIDALGVSTGETIADMGAGTGYFATAFAARVGLAGRVFAVEMQAEMLVRLRDKLAAAPTLPIDPILSRMEETPLGDESVDLVFFGSVWHEIEEPAMVLLEARRVMKIDGRIAIVDWRADVAAPPGPPLWHRQKVTEVAAVLARERWKVRITRNVGPYSYLVVADLK